MTPQEKALSLCKKFNLISHKDKWGSPSYTLLSMDSVKDIALTAVDEIVIEQCKSSEYKDAKYQDERVKYWLEVKQEIEKL